jgi:hypothetical protein
MQPLASADVAVAKIRKTATHPMSVFILASSHELRLGKFAPPMIVPARVLEGATSPMPIPSSDPIYRAQYLNL